MLHSHQQHWACCPKRQADSGKENVEVATKRLQTYSETRSTLWSHNHFSSSLAARGNGQRMLGAADDHAGRSYGHGNTHSNMRRKRRIDMPSLIQTRS
jgi:hypothetical protein